jgi:hypothetical protein
MRTRTTTGSASERHGRWWQIGAIGCATVIAVAALSTPAHAMRSTDDPPPDGDPEPTLPTTRRTTTTTTTTTLPPTVQPRLGSPYAAPTPNLNAVANAIGMRTKSATAVVTIPAGLPVTAKVEISILFGYSMGHRMTQTYDPLRGNKFVNQFGSVDGAERDEHVDISFVETDGSALTTYALLWSAHIKPLYDVWISPLTFEQESECDWIGDSEIELLMFGPDGQRHEGDFDSHAFMTTVRTELAGHWRDVGLDAGLVVPTITWEEDDIELPPYGFHTRPRLTAPLLPFHSGHFQWRDRAYGQECSALLSYDTNVSLNVYGDL